MPVRAWETKLKTLYHHQTPRPWPTPARCFTCSPVPTWDPDRERLFPANAQGLIKS